MSDTPGGSREARRQRLETLRAEHGRALAEGRAEALLAEVAEEDPVLLMEIGLGPRAPGGGDAARAMLTVRAVLLEHMSDKALLTRLVDLARPDPADEVLAVALEAHPVAGWVMRLLGDRAADPAALLMRVRERASFGATCAQLVESEVDAVLQAYVRATGDTFPAVVAWDLGREALGVRLGAGALSVREPEAVFCELVAAWGPEVDALCLALLPYLGQVELVRAVAGFARGGGTARKRLELVVRGLSH